MFGRYMGDLVGDHRRQLVIVLDDFKQAGEYADFAAGHREGVDLIRHVEHDELPVGVRHVPDRNRALQALADPLEADGEILVA